MNRMVCILGALSLGVGACTGEAGSPKSATGAASASEAAAESEPTKVMAKAPKPTSGVEKAAKPAKVADKLAKTGEKPAASGEQPASAAAGSGTEVGAAGAGTPDKSKTVYPIAFDARAFPAARPPGEVLGGFAFHDTVGDNYVIFAREDRGSDDRFSSSVLRIKHVVKSDSGVREVRMYTERVDDCDLDIFLEPQFGDWSVSDVDQNGVGEASFAYSVACVSDVSPLGHKAFVTEGGQKYVLRGIQRVKYPDSEPEGGTYKADTMPAAFMEKAREVWELTARGPGTIKED